MPRLVRKVSIAHYTVKAWQVRFYLHRIVGNKKAKNFIFLRFLFFIGWLDLIFFIADILFLACVEYEVADGSNQVVNSESNNAPPNQA